MMAPRERGAISPRDSRVTKRESSYVAAGQARHELSISGLPARGCPFVSRWSSGSRPSAHFFVYSLLNANGSLDFWDKSEVSFRRAGSRARAQVRRPASTASAMRPPSSAPATTARAQCRIHAETPCGDPVPYPASAPR